MVPADDDPKVKDMLDAATRADLERWFGLPSFQEVPEQPAAKADRSLPRADDDPDVIAVRERRAKAIAAVDPKLLDEHRRRTEPPPDLIKFAATIDVVANDPSVIDTTMIDRLYTPADIHEQEWELFEPLRDVMTEVTPQAILRDL